MEWLLPVIFFIGYGHLLNVVKNRHVVALVKLNVQSREKDDSGDFPKNFSVFSKSCKFIITPVPGMEFNPSGIESAEIKRVVLDEDLVEVFCVLETSPITNDFGSVVSVLKEQGWREKVF